MMNEYTGLVRCYFLPGQVPTVAELAVEIQEALRYAEDPLATDMRDLLQQLLHMTDAVVLRIVAQSPDDAECRFLFLRSLYSVCR